MTGLFVGFVIAFLISLAVTPFVSRFAFYVGAVDRPDARKVHSRLMPRLGGLGIYLAFTLTVLLMEPMSKDIVGLLLGGTLIMVIGFIDDIRNMSPRTKLLGQIVAASVLVVFGIKLKFITNPFGALLYLQYFGIDFGIPLTILWVVGVTNAVNLVDGLDGLAGGLASIAAMTIGVIAWHEGQTLAVVPAVVLCASITGFLKYNFHPAKIFMGDSGSLFLGYMLAGLSLMGLTKGASVITIFVPVLIFGIPIFDTLFAILRRYINNKPIFQADKEHLHHRLLALGLSHRQTVLVIYAVSCFLGVSAVFLTFLTTAQAFAVFVGISVLVFVAANRVGVLSTKVARRMNAPEAQNKTNLSA
ncbi:MAG TPA: MraY family glycosyltransferase [Desulfobacteria bacterium]|nr:MraY family glycosyltransferase [Desulfobacteria bacterium]